MSEPYETLELRFEGCGHIMKIPLLHNPDDSKCFICHPELRDRPMSGKCPKCIGDAEGSSPRHRYS
jgi:hypothetical protein